MDAINMMQWDNLSLIIRLQCVFLGGKMWYAGLERHTMKMTFKMLSHSVWTFV